MVNTTTTRKTSFHEKIFSGPCSAKDPGNIIVRKFHSTKHKTMLFIYKNKKTPNKAGSPTHLQARAQTARL
jgi:hypothetical protein